MMESKFIRHDKNEDDVGFTVLHCGFCDTEYTICPQLEDNEIQPWVDGGCTTPECDSYDPNRDCEILFISDEELAKRDVVGIKMLKARREGNFKKDD